MSEVINPPDYYFTGINFNPAFYADDTGGGGLSEATANTLYLRKTVPDTANVVETFTKDIICTEAITAKDDLVATTASVFMSCTTSNPKIDLMADTGRSLSLRTTSIQVGASSPLDIATYVDVDLNVGTGGRTGLGTGPSPFIIHNYSDANNCLAGNNVHLNNGTNNLSNTAIHNGTSSGGAVNIMTGTSSTGIVNIGTTGTTTNLNGTVKINSITAPADNSNMTIGSNLTTGTMTIGSSLTTGNIALGNNNTSVVQVNGRLQTNFVRSKNIIDTLQIADDQTSGILNLGYRPADALRTGAVNIGSANSTTSLFGTAKTNTLDALSATATMNLASSLTSGTINLMTNNVVSGILNLMYNAVSSATGTINIGQYNTSPAPSRTTTNIRGDVNIGGSATETSIIGTAKCDAIAGIATTGTQSLYATKTAGELTCLAAGTGVLNVKGSGIKFDTLSTDNPTGAQGLYTNKTAGTLSIATSMTSGNINIGSGIAPVTSISGQLLVGSQPASTNACLSVGSNSTCPNGIINWAFNDANGILSCFNSVQVSRGGIQGVNAGTIVFNATSDRRLKKDIKPMNSMLDTIMSLKPCEYRWVSCNELSHGFIAQEVHKLFPEMRYGANGCEDIENPCDCETGEPVYYGLDYGRFTPYIVKAFQELKQDYDAKLSKLEARLLALELASI